MSVRDSVAWLDRARDLGVSELAASCPRCGLRRRVVDERAGTAWPMQEGLCACPGGDVTMQELLDAHGLGVLRSIAEIPGVLTREVPG